MRVTIAGAGKVGRSIAAELLDERAQVLLIDKDPALAEPGLVPGAAVAAGRLPARSPRWTRQALQTCQVVVAATGDDKANLVVSLLAKTEYGVPRVVARVNHPKNEWIFDESWGVDVAVSTPRMLSALVEEAVTVGDLVRLFTFGEGNANLVEITLSPTAAVVGSRVGDVQWPTDTALVAIIRDTRVIAPSADEPLEAGDELMFVAVREQEPLLQSLLGV